MGPITFVRLWKFHPHGRLEEVRQKSRLRTPIWSNNSIQFWKFQKQVLEKGQVWKTWNFFFRKKMVLGPGTLRARKVFFDVHFGPRDFFPLDYGDFSFFWPVFLFFPVFRFFYLALLCVYLVCFHKTWCKWLPGDICFHSYAGYVVITCRVSWLSQNQRWMPLIKNKKD